MILIFIVKLILLTQVSSYRHEDNNTRRLLETIRQQLTRDNHDYIDTTTDTGSIYITVSSVTLTDGRRHMDTDKENDIAEDKAVEKKLNNDEVIVDDNKDNVLKHVLRKESKPNTTKRFMMYDNKKGVVSLVRLAGQFPKFRLPRDRAQYRASQVE